MGTEQEQQAEWDAVMAERSADQPVVTPTVEPVAETNAKPDAAPVTTEPAKPTTEELLTQALSRVEKLEGRTRNVEGHIGGLTSQQKVMQETFTAARNAAAEVSDAPSQAQVKEAMKNPEQWDRLKEDFPEWSDATERFLDAKLAGIKPGTDAATVTRMVAEAVNTASTRITQEVEAKITEKALQAVFPGWQSDVKTDAFGTWLNAQAQNVKDLANSDDVGDAAQMLSLYGESKKSNPAQQILNTRKQKLEQAVAAPRGTRPAPTKTPDQMSAEELWNYEDRLRQRARASSQ